MLNWLEAAYCIESKTAAEISNVSINHDLIFVAGYMMVGLDASK